MNYTQKKSFLIQLKTNAAIIHWLAEAAEKNFEGNDIFDRLETIADLADDLAEDARAISMKFDPANNDEDKETEQEAANG